MELRPSTSLTDLQNRLYSGELSVQKVLSEAIVALDQNAHLGPFLEDFRGECQEQAEKIDQKIASGNAGKLAGLILGIKDVFAYGGHPLTAGSKILKGFKSQFTGTALQRLIDADALIIGRQNCDEFAMGSSNENSAYGPVRNAIAPDRVPGGSSGGSAVAIQAGMCQASLATDTGGSIRQPAAFCGLVGLKPTYSRVSRNGLIAYGSSFDCVGPLTRNVADAALILEVMAGPDPKDPTCSSKPNEPFFSGPAYSKPRTIAYWEPTLTSDSIQPEIREALARTLVDLQELGHKVLPVQLPYLDYVLPTYYILTTCEASSNLSRYDGMHFGHRTQVPGNLEETLKRSRSEGFGPEVRRRILLGTFALSADFHEAFFSKAQKVRRLIQNSALDVFQKYDFLLMPTTPTTAFPLGSRIKDPMEMYLADIFTVWANLAGVPAISLPCGKDAKGLPIGLQFHAGHFQEKTMLDFARELEIKFSF